MFSWFLKLLGINEDKPVVSKNSFLDTSTKSESDNTVKETIADTAEQPEPQQQQKETPEAVEKSTDTLVEPEPKSEEPVSRSLADDFPDLKANYIKVLNEAGYTSKALIDKAGDKELLELKGIGKATLKLLRV